MDNQTPITDVSKYVRKKYGKVLIIAIAITVVLEIILVWILITYSPIFQLLFFPPIIFAVFYGVLRQKAEDAFFQQFSSVNGFSFQKIGLPGNLDGSLFFVGRAHLGLDLVSGVFQNTSFNLFNYRYTVGSGKSSHTYVYTIFRMNFTSSLPPIFLKPKFCEFGGFFFGDISKDAKEKLKLEGDFDKYFDLWTGEGFEVEALQVFAPDFMQKIQDNWKNFSVEFINNQIYVYSHHMITKDEELENMYHLIQYLVSKITPFAKETKGDIEALDKYYK